MGLIVGIWRSNFVALCFLLSAKSFPNVSFYYCLFLFLSYGSTILASLGPRNFRGGALSLVSEGGLLRK